MSPTCDSRRRIIGLDPRDQRRSGYRGRRPGDRVEWNFGRGTARGRVQRKLTAPTTIGGQKVAASADDPRILVKTDSGKEAAKKPQTLRRISAR